MNGREELPEDPSATVVIPLWLGLLFVVGGYVLGVGLAIYESVLGDDSFSTYVFALALILFPHVATKPLLVLRLLARGISNGGGGR